MARGKCYLAILFISLFLLTPLALSQGDIIIQQSNQAKSQEKEKPKKQRLPIWVYLPNYIPKENLDYQNGKLDLSLDFLYDYSEFFEYNQYLSFYQMTPRVTLRSWNLLFGGPAKPFANAPLWDGLFLPVYSLHRDPVLRTFWWDW